MKVLFATTNPAKVKKYAKLLQEKGIELITLNDLDFKLDIKETGKNAIENAYIKAKAYYDATNIPTIGMDNNLFIEELPDERQIGTHVRRINGKELTDDEMIEYYTNLVKEFGKKLTAKWVYGMVVCCDNGENEYTWSKDHFYFVDTPCEKRNPGYPLDSISIVPEFNKYLVELTEEDKLLYKKKDNIDGVINFIVESVSEHNEIDASLVKYIEKEIFPLYSRNEEGHGIKHIKTVIEKSLKLSKNLDVDKNLVYTIAAYHDIGHYIDRKTHEIISADIFMKDEKIKKWFNDEERNIIKEAIEDHRSTNDKEPRTIYGKIVSSADRTIMDIDETIKRSYSYGLKHYKNITEQQQIERVYNHLFEKYSEGGYAKHYLDDEEYDTSLKRLREALSNKDEFIKRIINVIK